MNTDTELLRRYVDEKSQAAFTELVQRYVGLVYSVALRRVGGDTHLAEDVAQMVFTDLARKADGLRSRETLGGWLYLGAHAASAAVVRSEQRRKAREFSAHTMHAPVSEAEPDWGRMRPVIDDAIVDLKHGDREAVVLRFFEQRSFAEVGAALQLTEEAARKRVARALEKLRDSLARRGITSTVAALGLALTGIASTSVPTGLGTKVASTALAKAGTAAGAASLGWFAAALPAAAVLIVGGLALGQRRANDHLRDELGRVAVDDSALVALQKMNRDLARNLVETDALRVAGGSPAPAPAGATLSAPAVQRPIAASVALTPQGTIAWNNDHVSLRDFIERLARLKTTAVPGSRLQVRANGASYSAVTYVIEEARKAGIEHLTVEGSGKSADGFAWWWF
jgi:RNA polymerase sigma factor (sigma-70 family)